jgi:hypothetical protein
MKNTYQIAAYYTESEKVKKITETTTLTKVESESAREVIETHSWDGDYEAVPAPIFIIAEVNDNEDVRLFAFENYDHWDEECGPLKHIYVDDLKKLNEELKNYQGERFEDVLRAAQDIIR